ncbi:lipopolysaccharide assembly protein LapA domain-containing protein [Pseudomonas sp. TMB3-21]
MRNFQRVLLAVLGLLIVLAILAFVLENQQSVSLQFVGWAGPELPVAVAVVIAFLLGMLIGPVTVLLRRSTRRRKRPLV